MKKMFFSVFCSALLLFLSGCFLFIPYNGPDKEYKLQMYISLGLTGTYPAEYPGNTIDDLAGFGGKNVIFSVQGLDPTINDSIDIQQTAQFGWTGGSIDSSTQYASTEIDLTENTMYLTGSYKFRMYIDWDGSGTLNSGDLVFNSYSILADKDDDETTEALAVTASEYGTAIEYSADDYSLIIEDPLSEDAGLSWIITAIHEGELAVYP